MLLLVSEYSCEHTLKSTNKSKIDDFRYRKQQTQDMIYHMRLNRVTGKIKQ